MITPPVAPDVLAALEHDAPAELSALQKLVKSDKSAVVAALLHIAVLLVAVFGLHLTAKDTAVLGSIVAAGVSYFLSLNLHTKVQAASNSAG